MKYSTDQLPFKSFEKLGLAREDVLSFPESTLNALLSGNRTSLIRFEKVNLANNKDSVLDAKLSLERNPDGSLEVKVHPINEKLTKTFGLSQSDLKFLKDNELSFKPIKFNRGDKTIDALATYDRVTNEIIAIDRNKLKAPDYINGQRLSEGQKGDFLLGKPITIIGNKYRLNPLNEFGISGESLGSVKIGHSNYVMPNVGVDAALIAIGLGHYFMLYHLANILINSKYKSADIDNSMRSLPFRDAIAAAKDAIIQKNDVLGRTSDFEKTKKGLSIDEIREILEHKAGEHVVFENIGSQEDLEGVSIKSSLKTDDEDNDLPIEQERPRSYSIKM